MKRLIPFLLILPFFAIGQPSESSIQQKIDSLLIRFPSRQNFDLYGVKPLLQALKDARQRTLSTPSVNGQVLSSSTSGVLSWASVATPSFFNPTPPITYNSGTGAIGIGTATSSTSGSLSSTDWNTFNNKQAALVSGTNIRTVNGNTLIGSTNLSVGDALVANPLSQFAATTSAQLRGILSDEVGTGAAYFVGGALGTPASATLTSATGLPLTTGVTGILPVANGGTGLNAMGSALQQLRVNSAGTALEWATISSSGTGISTFTTTGSSGAATWNSGTGTLNIPNYTLAGLGGLPVAGGTMTGDITLANFGKIGSDLTKAYSQYYLSGGTQTNFGTAISPDGTKFSRLVLAASNSVTSAEISSQGSGSQRSVRTTNDIPIDLIGDAAKYDIDYTTSFNAIGARAIPDRGYNDTRYYQKTDVTRGAATLTYNGSTTVFTIAHGLGSTPVSVPLSARTFTSHGGSAPVITVDATNITITYAVAPSAGSNIIDWAAFK